MEQTVRSESPIAAAPAASRPEAAPGAEAPAPGTLSGKAHLAVDRIAAAASQSAQRLDAQRQRIREAGTRAVDGYRSYVQGHPEVAVGVAFVAGFLIRHWIRMR